MSISVNVHDEDAFNAAFKDFRNDKNDTDWLVVGHVDMKPNEIVLIASGSGGVATMMSHFDDNVVTYGLVRITEKIDMSVTTKFVFVHCIGSKVSFVKKGRFGVVRGAVLPYFEPYHVDFSVESACEVTPEAVVQKVSEASMQADKILVSTEGRQMRGFTSKPTNQESPNLNRPLNTDFSKVNVGSTTANQAVNVDASVTETVRNIRNDGSSTDWMVASYPDGNVKSAVTVIAQGSGGLSELVEVFTPKMCAYGFFRTSDTFDGIKTTKFVYINWVGDDLPHMDRATVSTHKGALEEAFAPFHVDFKGISQKKAISENEVRAKIEAASGSFNQVRS